MGLQRTNIYKRRAGFYAISRKKGDKKKLSTKKTP
jgi:hypothetical protein